MKTVLLNDFWSKRLAQMPESGMGYQKVDVVLRNHRVIENVIVLNAEECQSPEDFDPSDIADVKLCRR